MSDYLNSLVVRTLHLEPVVQPRLTSLFEPPSAATGTEPAPASQFESATEDSIAPESTSEVFPSRLPAQTIQQPGPITIQIPHAQIHQRETTESDNSNQTVNVQPSPTLLPAQVIPLTGLFEPKPNIQGFSDDEQVTPHSSNTVSENSSREKSNHQNRRVINPEVRRRTIARDREQNDAPSIPDSHAILTYASPQPASPSGRVSAQASAFAEPPETVVVTIGRVDVRAIFTPPSAAPRSNRSQPPQPMSLDEYLKRRAEKRR